MAEALLPQMLDQAGVDIRLGGRDAREAAAYVDASYEGDLMAALGVPYAVGPEPRELYSETWAGRQPAYQPSKHNFAVLVPPYPIPHSSLIPRRDDSENLLVPLCLSASHVASGSVRMEPTLMLLGHAAGLAAAQVARRGVAVQDIDVDALQQSLLGSGQVPAL